MRNMPPRYKSSAEAGSVRVMMESARLLRLRTAPKREVLGRTETPDFLRRTNPLFAPRRRHRADSFGICLLSDR